MPDRRMEIEIIASGAKTLGEMRKEVANLKKEVLNLVPGTKEFSAQSQIIADKQTAVNQALSQGWSESAKMRNAYFRTGLELRQLILTSGLAKGAFGEFSGALSNSVLNAVQLRSALIPLGISMGGVGIALTALMSVAPSVISFFKNLKDDVTKSSEAVDGFIKASQGASIGPFGVKGHTEQIQLLKDEEDRVRIRARGLKDETQRIMLLQKAGELERERLKHETAITEIMERQRALATEGALRLGPLSSSNLAPGMFPGLSAAEQSKTMSKNPMFDNNLWDDWEKQDAFALKQIQEAAKQVNTELKLGAQQFSSTLINALVQGRDLAQSIGLALLGVLINVGTNYLTSGITSLIGGAAPGGGVSLSANRAGGPGFQPGFIAETRVKGSDLIIALKATSMKTALVTY